MSCNKKGVEMSFTWLFAIIVGAVVIFLAIYATTSIINTERQSRDSEIGKQIGILLSPLESGIASGKTSVIDMPFDSRIYNKCGLEGPFGVQEISVATKSGIGKEWDKPGAKSQFYNKYLFSEEVVEGNDFAVFSKSLDLPFSIGEMIILWPDDKSYCFVQAPNEIAEEILALKPRGVNLSSSERECPRNSTKVCFTTGGCEVDVAINSKSVKKAEKTVYYTGALVYGAIFASPEVYECQVKRLMKRASELSSLYAEKSNFLEPKGCQTSIVGGELQSYSKNALSFNNSIELRAIETLSEEIRRHNELLNCKVY